jgi:transposase
MRHAREIIRLKFSSVSTHEIARRLGMARSTVREALKRTETAGLSWPLPEEMSDGALEAALYASRRSKRGHRRVAEPDWAGVHRELKRKHVTLLILWDEYIAANPGGYSYSRFCELYRSFEKTVSVTMRQTHAAGERLFVDYAGDGVPVVIDRLTGEIRMAQIFVAVLGASSFTFAKASWTQALPDWIDAHVRAFEAIGGVPELVVPDNAKTARRQGQLLRLPGQSDLRRDGGALRNRHSASQAEKTPRQGESRAGGADRRAMAARPAEAPDLPQSCRRRRRDRRAHGATQ